MLEDRFKIETIDDEKYIMDAENGEMFEMGDERLLENINSMHRLIGLLIEKCESLDVDIRDELRLQGCEYDYLIESSLSLWDE